MASYEALLSQINELKRQIEETEVENSIYQKFVEIKSIELGEKDDENKKKKKNRKSEVKDLTKQQKVDIVTAVHDDCILVLENDRRSSEKMLDTLRNVIDEAEIRINEIKRDTFEFRRDVVMLGNPKDSPNGSTKKGKSSIKESNKMDETLSNNIIKDKIIQEKLTRYLNEKTTQIDATVEKLKLKNISLKVHINKIEQQLTQKEDAGDSLHYIDFHQLQIENKQNIVKLGEKNDELISLKQSTAKTIQILNDIKFSLNEKNEETSWLNNEIIVKEKTLEKLKAENVRSRKSIHMQTQQLERLQAKIDEIAKSRSRSNSLSSVSVPSVHQDDEKSEVTSQFDHSIASIEDLPNIQEYIEQKKQMYEYQEGIKNLNRKIEILQLAAKNLNIKY